MITDLRESLPIHVEKFYSDRGMKNIKSFLNIFKICDNIIAVLNFRENISGGFFFDVLAEHEYMGGKPILRRIIISFSNEKDNARRGKALTLKWLRVITKIFNKNKNLYPIENFNKKFLKKCLDRPENYLYPFDDFGIGYLSPKYLSRILTSETDFATNITELLYHCEKIDYTGKILIMSDTGLNENNIIYQKLHDYLQSIGRYDLLLEGV